MAYEAVNAFGNNNTIYAAYMFKEHTANVYHSKAMKMELRADKKKMKTRVDKKKK